MNALDTSPATSAPPLVRFTLTLGPEDRRALAQFVALSGATSRPDVVRELAARLSAAPAAVRSRIASAAVPPLPADSSQSKRLDARISPDDRAEFERWCGDRLRPQDALRAALHLLATDAEFAAELGYGEAGDPSEAPAAAPRRPEPVRTTPATPRHRAATPAPTPPPPPRREPPPARREQHRRRTMRTHTYAWSIDRTFDIAELAAKLLHNLFTSRARPSGERAVFNIASMDLAAVFAVRQSYCRSEVGHPEVTDVPLAGQREVRMAAHERLKDFAASFEPPKQATAS